MRKFVGQVLLLVILFGRNNISQAQIVSEKSVTERGMIILDGAGGQTSNYFENGLGINGTFEVAVRFTPEELMRFYGQKLSEVDFVVKGDEWSDISVKVYKGSSNSWQTPGELIYTKQASNVYSDYFNNVDVSEADITLEYGYDYWLAYEITSTGGYPIGCDIGPAKRGKSQWIKINGCWREFSQYGAAGDVSWLIRGTTSGISASDTQAPVLCSISCLDVTEKTDMKFNITVADKSGMPPIFNAAYNIGSGDQTIQMNRTSEKNIYEGVITKQPAGTSGFVKIQLKDSLDYSTWTSNYAINWLNKPFMEENFDHVVSPALPSGWKAIDSNADQIKWKTGTNPDVAYSPSNVVYMSYSPSQKDMDDWLISPSINCKAGKKYNIRFKYRADSNINFREYSAAYIGNSQTVSAMEANVPLWTDFAFSGENYRDANLTFTPLTDGVYYVGLHGFSSYINGNVILIDDFTVHSNELQDDVTPPSFIDLTGATAPVGQPLSLNLKVYDVNGVGGVTGYYKLNGQTDFTPFNLQVLNGKPDFNFCGVIVSPTNETTGVVKFVAKDNSPAQNTSTSVEYPIAWQAEFNEGFENAQFPPAYWYLLDLDGDKICWKQSFNSSFNVHSGNKMAYSESQYSLPDNGLITPVYLVKTGGQMKFWRSANDATYCLEEYTVGVAVRSDLNSNQWAPTANDFVQVFKDSITTQSWKEKIIDLNNYVGKQVRLMIRHKNSMNMFMLGVDDVKFVNCDMQPVDGPVSINEQSLTVLQPTLHTNYPNPFNPETTISYTIPKDGKVKLTVYDCKGALVSLLENSNKQAGTHTIIFKANGLTSGVYFYTLEYNGIKFGINKMMMIK